VEGTGSGERWRCSQWPAAGTAAVPVASSFMGQCSFETNTFTEARAACRCKQGLAPLATVPSHLQSSSCSRGAVGRAVVESNVSKQRKRRTLSCAADSPTHRQALPHCMPATAYVKSAVRGARPMHITPHASPSQGCRAAKLAPTFLRTGIGRSGASSEVHRRVPIWAGAAQPSGLVPHHDMPFVRLARL